MTITCKIKYNYGRGDCYPISPDAEIVLKLLQHVDPKRKTIPVPVLAILESAGHTVTTIE